MMARLVKRIFLSLIEKTKFFTYISAHPSLSLIKVNFPFKARKLSLSLFTSLRRCKHHHYSVSSSSSSTSFFPFFFSCVAIWNNVKSTVQIKWSRQCALQQANILSLKIMIFRRLSLSCSYKYWFFALMPSKICSLMSDYYVLNTHTY